MSIKNKYQKFLLVLMCVVCLHIEEIMNNMSTKFTGQAKLCFFI